MATVDQAVRAYIKARDMKDALRKKHQAEMEPLNNAMEKLEAWLLKQLNDDAVESMRTAHGTVYKSKRTGAKIEDWDSAFAFIKEHELWHMLEKRVSKTAVDEYMESQGEPPPGVSISVETRVNIRR